MELHDTNPLDALHVLLDDSQSTNEGLGDIALARAKRPASVVAGPYGHPLHPSLVAVPIGAWVTAFVFDVRSLFSSNRANDDVRAAGNAMAVGIGGALAAAGIGALDWQRLTPRTQARAYGTAHAILNIGITAFYIVAWRRRVALSGDANESGTLRLKVADVASHAVALGILSGSGILGGELAFRFGVRVADETTQRRGHTPST
ncbi:MAG: DUF2231 domain-containing protein [Candidatus Velthaea sp.]